MSVKGLKPVLLNDFEAELPESEMESGQTARQKKAVKKNAMEMGYIEMAMSLAQWITKIEKEKKRSNSWPNGRSFCIAEMLLNKYRPKDILSAAKQKKRLMSLDFKMGQDLMNYLLQLLSLKLSTGMIGKKVIKWMRS